MKSVANYSRHPFNDDQLACLRELGFHGENGARAPFFNSGDDIVKAVDATGVASLVSPGDLLMDAQLAGLSGQVIFWRADQASRSRKTAEGKPDGHFACRGAKVYTLDSGRVKSVDSIDWIPTVETSFGNGSTRPYQG